MSYPQTDTFLTLFYFFLFLNSNYFLQTGFPCGSAVKNLPASTGCARDTGSIPGSGISLGGGNGNPFQYSCLGNPMDRGAWWATVHEAAKSWTRLRVCAHTHTLEVQDQCGSRLVFSAASSWLADSCPLQVPSRCETAVSSHHLCSALAHPWSQCVPTSSSSKDSSHMGLELTLTVSF